MNQRPKNALEHHVRLLQRLMVPEPNHAKSRSREISSALQIMEKIIRVLPTVQLDDQARTDANKVYDVSTNRLLSTEAVVAEMSIAQVTPETTFGVGGVRA